MDEHEIMAALTELGRIAGSNRDAFLAINTSDGLTRRVQIIVAYSNGASEDAQAETIGEAIEKAKAVVEARGQ